MVYIMEFFCDGGCRNNGYSSCYGAAAAVIKYRSGQTHSWTRYLDENDYPRPTNQRAEIAAIIIALEEAINIYDCLDSCPRLDLTISTDSRYAIGCMTEWIHKWVDNGWMNVRGQEVANRDLIEEASRLDGRVRDLGSVQYTWIPREKNRDADEACNGRMDQGY